MEQQAPKHYRPPNWFTREVVNRVMSGFTRAGLSIRGSRVLEVRGRRSGQPRRVPVNLLTLHGTQYLVAPRGETEWVRNLRADGGRLQLLLGATRVPMVGTELSDDDKVPVLRAYLARWKAEVGVFFDGVGPESTDDAIAAIASRHPVFRLNSP